MPNEEWIPAPGFTEVDDRDIWGIVLHTTEGSLQSAINTLLNPARQASYHLIADLDAQRLVRMVKDKDIAWHAGTIAGVNKRYLWGSENENNHTLGMAMAGFAKNPKPQAQLDLVLDECKKWIAKYPKILIERAHIVSHSDIATDRSDPGIFPWDWFMAQLRGEDNSRVKIDGFEIQGGFLVYFKEHGGIHMIGKPLSNEFKYEGRTTQLFERYVLQWFPEYASPWDIQGMRLGDFWAREKKLIGV